MLEPLGSSIRSQRPESLDEAVNFLVEEENISYLQSNRTKNDHKAYTPPVNTPNHPPTRFCNYCKKTGHTLEACFKRKNVNNRSVNNQINRSQPNSDKPDPSHLNNNNRYQKRVHHLNIHEEQNVPGSSALQPLQPQV